MILGLDVDKIFYFFMDYTDLLRVMNRQTQVRLIKQLLAEQQSRYRGTFRVLGPAGIEPIEPH